MSDNTQSLLDSRRSLYGDITVNMAASGKMVNAYLDGIEQRTGKRELEEVDFAMVMVLYKIYRFAVSPTYGDHINDIKGYVKMIEQIMGDTLIDAKTPDEYYKKVAPKESDRAENNHPELHLCESHADMHPYDGPNVTIVRKRKCDDCKANRPVE